MCIYPSLDEAQGEVWKSVADFAGFRGETQGTNMTILSSFC